MFPSLRAAVFCAVSDGQTYRDVTARFNISISTVSRTITNFKQRNTFKTKSRLNVSTALPEHQQQIIFWTIKKDPKVTILDLKNDNKIAASISTISRFLKTKKLQKRIAKERIDGMRIMQKFGLIMQRNGRHRCPATPPPENVRVFRAPEKKF